MLLMWRKCKEEESNMSSLSEVDSMMELPYTNMFCVGGSLLPYLVFLFPEMMIREDPPMM